MQIRVRDGMWRLRGVISLSFTLTLIYGIDLLVANLLGFSSVAAMQASLSLVEKRAVVAIAGPLLHQGVGHLLNNLVFLLLFGGYVEWQLGLREFYGVAGTIGYLASWLLLSLGGAGAVGASSVTHGLETLTGLLGMVRLGEELPGVETTPGLLRATVHVPAFLFGLGFTYFEIREWLASPEDGTLVIHVLGSIVGGVIGVVIVLGEVRQQWRSS